MKQHPVRAAFEQVADRPSIKFRDDLRAQLLADLVAPTATTTPQTTQEIPVTDTPNPKPTRGRMLLGIAAAVIVAVGVTAVVMNQDDTDTSVPATDPTINDAPTTTAGATRSDAEIADAALLTEDDVGSPWNGFSSQEAFAVELDRQAKVPECADRIAAEGDLTIAKSTGTRFDSGSGQELLQTIVVFPTIEDATMVFEAFAAFGRDCGVATYGSAYGVPAVAVDFGPLTQYGDQQVSWGVEISLTPPHLTQVVWVQVDRALVRIRATNEAEGATNPDPLGMLESALSIAVDRLAAELAAG